jgi:hypothetical protein
MPAATATATAPAAPTETAAAPAPTETAPAPATPPPAPEPPAINVAAMKFAPKGGKLKAMELKGDGSVLVADKMVGKITSDQVQDADGKTLFTVAKDGTISGDALAKPVKFQGDELTGDDGYKVTVGDDGTVSVTQGKGKPTEVGKVDNASGNKRAAALLVAWSTIVKPQPATKAPAAGAKK